jgi:hypothetical protein
MEPLTQTDIEDLEQIIEFYETSGAPHTAALIHHALTLARNPIEVPEFVYPNVQRLFELQSAN